MILRVVAWLLTVTGVTAGFAAALVLWQLLADVDSRVLLFAVLLAVSVSALSVAVRAWAVEE
jgi:predicted Kef-type K+ transport protein